jgi:hypothetical protein
MQDDVMEISGLIAAIREKDLGMNQACNQRDGYIRGDIYIHRTHGIDIMEDVINIVFRQDGVMIEIASKLNALADMIGKVRQESEGPYGKKEGLKGKKIGVPRQTYRREKTLLLKKKGVS